MDHRHLIAYVVLLVTLACLTAAYWRATRHHRAARRASREFDAHRQARREETRTAGGDR